MDRAVLRIDLRPDFPRGRLAMMKRLAADGLRLLPIFGVTNGACDCGRQDCESPGKHPLVGRWVDEATSDAKAIKAWNRDHLTMNYAVATAGITVLDFDSRAAVMAFRREVDLPPTFMVKTARGFHFYYRGETSARIGLRPKLDIKSGPSSYVVGPGSRHASGAIYALWEDEPMADLPRAAIKAISAGSSGAREEPSETGPIRQGSRNSRLTSLAGAFRRQGFEEDVILAALGAVNDGYCTPPLSQKSLDTIARSVGRYEPADEGLFQSMANVTPRDVDFLWYPYLVRGAVNLLEGDPNVGKTYLLCAIAAAVSAGRPLPDQPEGKAGNVLFLSAEDDPETTLVRRLIRMDADLARVTFMTKFHRLEEEPLAWVEKHIDDHGVALVIMDPLLAYMQGGIDMNKANETRPFMARLAELAKSRNVTIIGLRHLNKSDKDKAIFRGLGSIDITAAARSAIMVGEHPEDSDLRVMLHIKHNLSEQGPARLYELTGGDRAAQKLPKLNWRGTCDIRPEDLARAAAKPGRPDTAIQDAKEFLKRVLVAEARPIKAVLADGEKRGHTDRTLRRAAKDLGVQRVGQTWKLAKMSL